MVWSSVAFPAHADSPNFLTRNALEGSTITPASKWTLTGNFASADVSDSLFPAYAAYDRNGAWHTQPVGATIQAYYMGRTVGDDEVALPGGPSKPFNTIIIQGLNAAENSVSGGTGLRVIVSTADSEDFGTNQTAIHDFSPSSPITTNNRLVANLSDTWETDRIRIWIRPDTPNFQAQPTITQVFLAYRNVLGRQPNHPWDERAFGSAVRMTKTISGIITTYGHDTGGRVAKMTFRSGVDTDRDTLRTAFAQMGYAGKPFYFQDRPNTIPAEVLLMAWKDPKLVNELFKGVSGRQTTIAMEEGAPYIAEE